jgi:hypothetical protein
LTSIAQGTVRILVGQLKLPSGTGMFTDIMLTRDEKYITVMGLASNRRDFWCGIYTFPLLEKVHEFPAVGKHASMRFSFEANDSIYINTNYKKNDYLIFNTSTGSIEKRIIKNYNRINEKIGFEHQRMARNVSYRYKSYNIDFNTYALSIFVDQSFTQNISNTEALVNKPGKYLATFFAVQNYVDPFIEDLKFPLTDARDFKNALVENYEFDSANVEEFQDAKYDDIMTHLKKLKDKCTEEDYLLIFFTGHGFWNKTKRKVTGFLRTEI